jgi:threonine dehydrogenase-like Zn-dependent dehydrogenase
MKVATWRGDMDFTVDEAPDPKPGSGMVVVKVHTASICASDFHAAQGLLSLKPPAVMGHEISGVIVDVGPGVDRAVIGLAVACEPTYGCGECEVCREGYEPECKQAARAPGYAQLALMPLRNAHALPAGLDIETAALTEPVACVVSNFEQFRMPAGATVLVVGAGVLGLAAVALAARRGAGTVVVSDLAEHRRRFAMQLGATVAIDPRSEDLRARVMDLTGGNGVDVGMEAVGEPRLLADVIRLTRSRGHVQAIGLHPAAGQLSMPVNEWQRKAITLGTTMGRGRSFKAALAEMPRLGMTGAITAKFGLDQAGEAFTQAASGAGIRTAITPNG